MSGIKSIELSDVERRIAQVQVVELSPAQIVRLRARADREKLMAELAIAAPEGELLKALKSEVETSRSGSTPVTKTEDAPTYELWKHETLGTGAWDEAEYIYGVLLRHGVMPAIDMTGRHEANDTRLNTYWKNIKQFLLKNAPEQKFRIPGTKYLDWFFDIGRKTYTLPTKWRNLIADKFNNMKRDEFDVLLMELKRDKDGNTKLLAALSEISAGLKNSQTKKDIDAMMKTFNKEDIYLSRLWEALNMDKEKVNLEEVVRITTEYAQSRAPKWTIVPPQDIKRHEVPAMQERIKEAITPQARNEEIRVRNLTGEFLTIAGEHNKLITDADNAVKQLEWGNNKPALDYLEKFGNVASANNEKIGLLNDQSLEKWLALPKVDQDAILKAAAGTAGFSYISRLATHGSKLGNYAEKSAKIAHIRPMRFMYGLIGIVAAGSITTEFAFGNQEVAKNDLKDIAYGFVPGYDLYRAWDGTDLNGRPLKWWDRFERAAWGTLTVWAAVATLGASSLVIGTLRGGVRWVKAANHLSHIVKIGSSGMAVASVSHFGYNLAPVPGWFNWKQVLPDGGSPVRIM
jgi:hypothetical protein